MEMCRTRLYRYLPPSLSAMLQTVPLSLFARVQELRLRVSAPMILSLDRETVKLSVIVTRPMLEECFGRLCGHAVHTHQEELAQGFVTTEDGIRAGIAGRAVMRDGRVVSYREITSLCIRLSRPMITCAAPLLPFVLQNGGVKGLLLCGAPSCGKTTVLRDLARLLAKDHAVTVVDERRELGGAEYCDVLAGCPKAVGILQAVRTLSPEVVIVDEVGNDEEWRAVATSCFLGVPVIASAHLAEEADIHARPMMKKLLANGGFPYAAFMPSRAAVCDATRIWKAGDLLENNGDRADRVFLRGSGNRGGMETEKHGSVVEGMGIASESVAWHPAVYRFAD